MGKNVFEPAAPPNDDTEHTSTWRKLGWFVLLSGVSGLCVIATAYALRGLLFI